MEGWIKLYRKLQDNKFWYCEIFTRGQAWVDLLLLANHKNSFFYCREHKISVKRGQVGWSENKLANRWKWSRNKVRKFLNDLKKEQQIEQQKSKSYSIITIVNYEKYQENGQQVEQQQDNSRTTERQQQDTNNNDKNKKNDKNEENINYPKLFEFFNTKCPSLAKVQKLTKQRKIAINARLNEYSKEDITKVIVKVSESDFLNGKNKDNWQATFDWIFKPANFVKILEDNYKNKPISNSEPGRMDWLKLNELRK